ncbi:MAG: hypothetical protein ACREJQ_08285 [bacterium]
MPANKPAADGKGRVSDEAVHKRTGKKWDEWFKILDARGAVEMGHTEIAALLYEDLKCPGWWNQMVAVEYERSRGLREKHQRPEGFEISVSKTITLPAATLFYAWQNENARAKWLPDTPIVIHKCSPNKTLRITWIDGKKSIDVQFYQKGDSKCQVVVQHGNLADAKAAEKMKAYWSAALSRMQSLAEQ